MVAEGNIKDWLSWKTKEIQREIEAQELLAQQTSIDMTAPAIIDVDVKNAFQSIYKHPLFDALAGTASKDYPSANIKKGNHINMPDIMKHGCYALLKNNRMEHNFAGRKVVIIDVDDCLSQSSP